ncbi:hypothetical protein [Desulfitobacterium sp. AusDCA]|uniref:hypothetical protein n=1 Tax=Desulfitobacterium sp. AusDCA TaxID=3240383 RepID=UPI003DA7576E
MQIILLGQTYTCENNMFAIEQIFQKLSQILMENGQRIVGLEVDGVEICSNFDQYITDHLNNVQTIVVKVTTEQEFLNDSLLSIHEYIERAVLEIDKLVDQFYHEVSSETWNTFAQLLEGLQYIMGSLALVTQHEEWYFNIRQFVLAQENLSKAIVMLQNAAENKDRVWLCDALLYEIIPSFKLLSRAIQANFKSARVY